MSLARVAATGGLTVEAEPLVVGRVAAAMARRVDGIGCALRDGRFQPAKTRSMSQAA